jgi:hypothetical protein
MLFSFTGMTKILVVNGMDVGSQKMEIVDLSDPTNVCQPSFLDEYPIYRVIEASGGLLTNNNVLICGGKSFIEETMLDDCFSINAKNGLTTTTAKLSQPRTSSASVVLNSTALWLTGGWLIDTGRTKSTEFVQLTGTTPGPDLPLKVADHCLVSLNDTTTLLIGGKVSNGTFSKATFYYNFEDKIWTDGPSLTIGRSFHSCELFKSPQYGHTDTVIVTGGQFGQNGQALASTEILNLNSNNPSWTSGIIICNYYIQITVSNSIVTYILWYCMFAGSNVPKATKKSKMVPTPDGTGVVLIGGSFTKQDQYELKCSSSSCNWSLMEQRLSVERNVHNAFYVPDGFAVCEN